MSRVVSLDLAAEPYRSAQPVRYMLSGNPCRVPTCEYLAGDAFICPSCVEEWEVHLGNVTALVEDLEVAQRKQVRFADVGEGGRTTPDVDIPLDKHDRILFADPKATRPDDQTVGPGDKIAGGSGVTFTEWEKRVMPGNTTASYWLARLGNELVGQIRLICETGHIRVPEFDGPVAMSRWLLRQSARLPKLPEDEGWGLVHDLDQVMRDALQAIDAPARRKYVRVCDCGLAVWARHAATARCACGAEYDVAAEYEARMEIAREAWVTIGEAADASGVKRQTIQNWVDRGKMNTYGKPQQVRYGDVLDRAAVAREAKGKTA